jgi:hypothetical protein
LPAKRPRPSSWAGCIRNAKRRAARSDVAKPMVARDSLRSHHPCGRRCFGIQIRRVLRRNSRYCRANGSLLVKMQSYPLAHELSNDIRKPGVLEALEQDAPACYAVSSRIGSKTQVLFPARDILGDRQIVCLQAQPHGLPPVASLCTGITRSIHLAGSVAVSGPTRVGSGTPSMLGRSGRL